MGEEKICVSKRCNGAQHTFAFPRGTRSKRKTDSDGSGGIAPVTCWYHSMMHGLICLTGNSSLE